MLTRPPRKDSKCLRGQFCKDYYSVSKKNGSEVKKVYIFVGIYSKNIYKVYIEKIILKIWYMKWKKNRHILV